MIHRTYIPNTNLPVEIEYTIEKAVPMSRDYPGHRAQIVIDNIRLEGDTVGKIWNDYGDDFIKEIEEDHDR